MLPSRRSPRPTLCRRGVRNLGWRWRDCARKRDPARMLLALRRRWHEGPADTTLLTSLRGWVSALLPGRHTTHIVRLVGQKPPTFILFVPTTPRQRDPSARNKRSDNVALCAIPPLHCHADCCRRKRHPRRHAPALVAWHSSRQLAGIPHANAAAPRVFLS